MNTVLSPVGPQPARVYWVRRLVVLVLVAAVITAVAMALGAARGGAAEGTTDGTTPPVDEAAAVVGDGAGEAATEQAVSEEPAPQEAEEPGDAGGACTPEGLTATLVADAVSYPAGATPTFTVTLTNSGSAACTVDAGLANQSLVVTSGADRIWSSADCSAEADGERLLLLAPAAAEAMPVAWPRVRSDEACTADLPEPRPGTYTAVAVVAGVQSGPVVFELG
jgi:hypothetical protein